MSALERPDGGQRLFPEYAVDHQLRAPDVKAPLQGDDRGPRVAEPQHRVRVWRAEEVVRQDRLVKAAAVRVIGPLGAVAGD